MRGNIFWHLSSLARAERLAVMKYLIRRNDSHKDQRRGAGITGTHPPVLSLCGGH
jgi:hypothetical protein